MKKIDIEGFEVGGKETFIIADIGSNHKQQLNLAKESIDAAIDAGANAVKFQSIQLDQLYLSPDTKTADFIRQLEFPEEWHAILKEYCDHKGIIFFSSPTYLKAVNLLEEVNVPLYKLASAQIGTFPQIVEKVAALNKPTIFSTGIAGYDETIQAVRIFRSHGNDKFIILHCNSIYPTPADRVNLPMIKTYRAMFGNPVGFSDHTNGIHIACAAVSAGAKVIEKHFTLDRNLNTPDCSSFASDPSEFGRLVTAIREIEAANNFIGDRIHIQSEENDFKESITYKIVLERAVEAGEILQEQHLAYMRTSAPGIDCKLYRDIIGKKVDRYLGKKTILSYDFIR